MRKIKNVFGHLRNILVHKYWVLYYGRIIGVNWWRLLMHDMSKFSPTECWESVRYYQGTSSPIPPCKADQGYSEAWQHHKGRNPHHYEYWTDNYDSGTTLIPMPVEYVEEMLADWMAAGRTYMGNKFTFIGQANWWQNKKKTNPAIHPLTIALIDDFFDIETEECDCVLDSWRINVIWKPTKDIYERMWKIEAKTSIATNKL